MSEDVYLELIDCQIPEIINEDFNLRFENGKNTMIVFTGDHSRDIFLDVIYGFYRPGKGEIRFKDQVYSYDYEELKKLRKKFSLVSLFGNLISNLTIYENLRLPLLSMPKLKNKDIPERIDQMVERFDLASVLEKLPDNLSDFEKVRVDFARGIGMEAEVYILNNLYEKLQRKSAKEFFESIIPELPCTISLSKSERGVEFCDRIVILDEEGVIYNGSAKNFGKSRRNKNEKEKV